MKVEHPEWLETDVLRWKDGQQHLTERIIQALEPVIASIAKKQARSRPGDIDDFAADGRMAALHALQTFDPTRGKPFLHYATTVISNRVRDSKRIARRKDVALRLTGNDWQRMIEDPRAAMQVDAVLDSVAVSNICGTWLDHAEILVYQRRPEAVFYQRLGAAGRIPHLGPCRAWSDFYDPDVLDDVRLCLSADGLLHLQARLAGVTVKAIETARRQPAVYTSTMRLILRRFHDERINGL